MASYYMLWYRITDHVQLNRRGGEDIYDITMYTFKHLLEKGLLHLFGELFLNEILHNRVEPLDRTSCTLALGIRDNEPICPEQVRFTSGLASG